MTKRFARRVRAYKEYLRKRIAAIKGAKFEIKLVMPSAKDFKEYLDEFYPGISCSNTARDIRELTNAGRAYDVEFHFLYVGQTSIEFIDRYSEEFLRKLVVRTFAPDEVNRQIGEINRNGKPVYQPL